MKILFDQGTPVPLRRHLTDHFVDTAFDRGWSNLENGDLLDAAEQDGFDLLITTDRNMKHQQNLAGRRLSVLVLLSTSWPLIRQRIPEIVDAISKVTAGGYVEVVV